MHFSARPITLDSHPKWIAVIDARDGDIERAARELTSKIVLPQFRAVSVVRQSKTLAQSAQLQGGRIAESPDHRDMDVLFNALGAIKPLNSIYGFGAAPYLHVDSSLEGAPQSHPSLLGGITGTMSLLQGGTCMIDSAPGDFSRAANGSRGWVWHYAQDEAPIDDSVTDAWQAQDGDPLVMKAWDWPEGNLPCVHFSPPKPENAEGVRHFLRGLAGRHV